MRGLDKNDAERALGQVTVQRRSPRNGTGN
jgi:hypothetical protein